MKQRPLFLLILNGARNLLIKSDRISLAQQLRVESLEEELRQWESGRHQLPSNGSRTSEQKNKPLRHRAILQRHQSFDYSSPLLSPIQIANSMGRLESMLITGWFVKARKSCHSILTEGPDSALQVDTVTTAIQGILLQTVDECFRRVQRAFKSRMDGFKIFMRSVSGKRSGVEDVKKKLIAENILRDNHRLIFSEFYPELKGQSCEDLARDVFDSIFKSDGLAKNGVGQFWESTHKAYETVVLGLLHAMLECKIQIRLAVGFEMESVGCLATWNKEEHEDDSCDPNDDLPVPGRTRIKVVLPRLYTEVAEDASGPRNYLTRAGFVVVKEKAQFSL